MLLLNQKKKVVFILLILLFLFFISTSFVCAARTTTIKANESSGQDAYIISSSNENYSYGVSSIMEVDNDSIAYSLVYLNLSTVSNKVIADADIYLYEIAGATGSHTISVYRITNSWNEGTGNAQLNNVTINGTTWLERW